MRQYAISEARAELLKIVGSADTVLLTRNGKPISVLMDYGLYCSVMADLELIADSDREQILDRHEQVQRGEEEGFTDLASLTLVDEAPAV